MTDQKPLHKDPRILQAKSLLLETLNEYKKGLTGIKARDSEKKHSSERALKDMEELRGAPLWYPYIGSGLGNGTLVQLIDGSVKYDCIIGIGVHILGHTHPVVVEKGIDAALTNTVMQGHLQQNKDTLTLLSLLRALSQKEHIFLTTSGAMALENGLKIALQKKAPANRILTFENSFSGRTLATSQISDKPKNRENLPLNVPVDYIPFFDPERKEESTREALNVLKKLLIRYPKQHALMVFELVQGEGGCYVGEKSFFKEICSLLREEGILILFDEVQTFGRLSKPFAFQHFELETFADIVTIGKASQVCATLFDSSIKPRKGLLSQTFTAATTQIQTGEAIIRHLIEGDYYGEKGRIEQIHQKMSSHLKRISQKYPEKLSGPFGIGLMIGMTPFGGDEKKVIELSQTLFEKGVISFIGGTSPTRLRFLLPAIIQDHEIDEIATLFEEALLS
jgi:acetylornithine aminotransferase